MTLPIQVLDSEAHTFEETKSTTVQQRCDQSVVAAHFAQNSPHFIGCADNGGGQYGSGAHMGFDAFEFSAEHGAVEKQKRTQGLTLGSGTDPALYCEMSQKIDDPGRAHFFGLTAIVVPHEAAQPGDVGLLAAGTVMAAAQYIAHTLSVNVSSRRCD